MTSTVPRFGVNYTPSRDWMFQWMAVDPDVVRADFEAIAGLGVDHVRVFPLWPVLQPNRTLIDAGALVAGGSDWPVSESPDPLEGMQGLVTRADPLGRAAGVLWPEQAISADEALEVFTINAARAMGLGEVTGSLTPGKSADFVVVDRDFVAGPADGIIATRVLETWFAGRLVYAAA